MTLPSITIPPLLDGAEYQLSQEMKCEDSKLWNRLKEAIIFCDNYESNCKGIHDKFCNGTRIFTCGKLTPSEDLTSPRNGCTYVKKGKERMFATANAFHISYLTAELILHYAFCMILQTD